jgi:predicted ATPase
LSSPAGRKEDKSHTVLAYTTRIGKLTVGEVNMRVLEMRIENYKSYLKTDAIPFNPGFNVVVGANNAGKTSLLEVLGFNFVAMPHRSLKSIPEPERPPNPISRVYVRLMASGNEIRNALLAHSNPIFVPAPRGIGGNEEEGRRFLSTLLSKDVELAVLYKATHNSYGFEASHYPVVQGYKPAAKVGQRPVFVFKTSEDRTEIQYSNHGSADAAQDSFLAIAHSLLQQVYVFKAERLALSEAPYGGNPILASNASNLAEVLHVLLTTQSARYARLLTLVKEIFPGVAHISVRAKAGTANVQEIAIWNEDAALDRPDLAFTLAQSGTGLGQVLAMLYVVLTSTAPRVIVIDEPNSFLHPGAARRLIRILKDFAQHQYIISTHSPEVVRAAEASNLIFLQKPESESRVSILNAASVADQQTCLAELGARLSDLFGADNVVWVEGPTEELAFQELLKFSRGNSDHTITAVLAVRGVGDFIQKQKRLKLVIDIYRRLTSSATLLPRTLGFIFDSEDLTEVEQADFARESNGLIHFLQRRMYENYLLVPRVVAEFLNSMPIFEGKGISESTITDWFERKGAAFSMGTSPAMSEKWLKAVHGARLLDALIADLSQGAMRYEKVSMGLDLTRRVLNESPARFDEVIELLRSVTKW